MAFTSNALREPITIRDEMPLILIADDEWMNRELMRTFLLRAGYSVIEARNGEQALLLAREYRPDLILLDVRMYDMNGFEVCSQLKSDLATRHISVVMLSALSASDEKERAVQAGATAFLSKSTNWTNIMQHVDEIVHRPVG